MIRELDLSNGPELLRLFELQRVSYLVEADLIGSSDIPRLKDTPRDLGRSGETFHGYFLDGKLVAAISHKRADGTVDLHRLVVHPDHFRKGIARSLMDHGETVERDADRVLVSTGADNFPATSLYRRLGFRKTAEREVTAGLRVASFEKTRRETVNTGQHSKTPTACDDKTNRKQVKP